MRKFWRTSILILLLASFVGVILPATVALAADTDTGFSLQVSPSPLVATIKPGAISDLQLKVRNAGTAPETLKIETRQFHIADNGQVSLDNKKPADIASWVSFEHPTFTVLPGQWATETIHIAAPASSGFSYSFALLISRASNPQPVRGNRLIKGSVAVFTLLNVDRPGAVRKLSVDSFTSSKHIYEYLPATLNIKLKNPGNTIAQPFGNVFIQRGEKASKPISTLPVNGANGYILPGATRSLSSNWNDGFPANVSTINADGSTKNHLGWDWSKLSDFRIGRYTAQLVAVYDDGHGHDVPLTGTLTFWVIPWKIILGLLVILILLGAGIWTFSRNSARFVRSHAPHKKQPKSKE
jgi:hypothetical protein